MRDLHNNIAVKRGISPAAAVTDNTAYVSQIVDTQGFGSCEFLSLLGSLAGAWVLGHPQSAPTANPPV